METYTVSDPMDYGTHRCYVIKSLTYPDAFCEITVDIGGKNAAVHINSNALQAMTPEGRSELIGDGLDFALKQYPNLPPKATLLTDWEKDATKIWQDFIAYYHNGFLPTKGDSCGQWIEFQYDDETIRPNF